MAKRTKMDFDTVLGKIHGEIAQTEAATAGAEGPTPLSESERQLLEKCELVIAQGLEVFLQVGQALLEIRELRLYRESFPTFEQYCKEKWRLSRSHIYRLIEASEVVANLMPYGLEDLPDNERHLRPLNRLSVEDQRTVWQRIRADLKSGSLKKLTAKAIDGYVSWFVTHHTIENYTLAKPATLPQIAPPPTETRLAEYTHIVPQPLVLPQEILNPEIDNQDLQNQDLQNQASENYPTENNHLTNDNFENPEILNPEIDNQDLTNQDLQGQASENYPTENNHLTNDNFENPEIEKDTVESGETPPPLVITESERLRLAAFATGLGSVSVQFQKDILQNQDLQNQDLSGNELPNDILVNANLANDTLENSGFASLAPSDTLPPPGDAQLIDTLVLSHQVDNFVDGASYSLTQTALPGVPPLPEPQEIRAFKAALFKHAEQVSLSFPGSLLIAQGLTETYRALTQTAAPILPNRSYTLSLRDWLALVG